MKPALEHCQYECGLGCRIHGEKDYPQACHDFICPYLDGEDIYRPDTFQKLLEELGGNMGNYIPSVSSDIPINEALDLIVETNALPASILIGNEWTKVIIPLKRHYDRSWFVETVPLDKWRNLYGKYDKGLACQKGGRFADERILCS